MTEDEKSQTHRDKLRKERVRRMIERQAKDTFARSFKPKKKR